MEFEEIDGDLLAAIEAAEYSQAEDSLHAFVRLAWPQVESTPFVDNWHVKLYCDELEAVLDGRTENLLWNSPPGTGKSVIEAVFFPAYAWGPARKPTTRFLFIAYGQELSTRDSVACRKLIQSAWYQRRWGVRVVDGKGRKGDDWPGQEGVQLTDDQNQKIRFDNTAGGWRIATSVGGRGTGEHPDIIIGGDLHKADEDSAAELQRAISFWDSTVGTRGVIRGSRRVVSGQRIGAEDISGHLKRQGGYVHICIPMEFLPGLMEPTPIGGMDPRTEPGELLWPAAIPPKRVEQMKARLVLPRRIAAQMQQSPTVDAGAVFRRELFRYYDIVPTETPVPTGYPQVRLVLKREDGRSDSYSPADCYWLQTIDTALKTKSHNDYTAIGTYLFTPDNDLLVWDMFRKRLEVPDQFGAIVAQRGRFPHLGEQAIEGAASGHGLLQQGRREGISFVEIKTGPDKIDNAQVVANDYANFKVFHPSNNPPWLHEFEAELLQFSPGCAHDDQVDTLSNAGQRKLQRSLQRHGVYAPAEDEPIPTLAELMGDMMPKDD